ncbi:hypothetical protein [Streptomyces sp. RB17]|uniref:hypothetical protein n=1 Tax=Streptomyces sp. RB17 TaxID=2585197 RepID=UPI001297A5AE|nr:hypothetical protein [Streptomyces sp. RB17]
MTSGNDYSAAKIRKTVWGHVEPGQDGGWVTTWRFTMDTSRVLGEAIEIVSEVECGFESRLNVAASGESTLTVKTVRPAMSAEYYPLTFRSFRIVNDEIGIIETIEGLPRDWYAPFRSL